MSTASTPLTTVRLYRQIAERVRELIAQGRFASGERLPAERDLALQLGVSRPSVREALIALEVEGLIEVRTGSGIYVCPPPSRSSQGIRSARVAETEPVDSDEWGPLEVLQARLLIEGELAALAAHNAQSAQLRAIRSALTLMRREAKAGRPPRDGDEAFHLAVAQASGNSVLLDTLSLYWRARDNTLFERLGVYFENSNSWQLAIGEHQAVLDCIVAHDAPGARRAMQSHLRKAFQRYSAGWRRAPH
ncbi:MAG: FadR family transcriptional regulator [Betaproteobacteria bacterium]|jgi:DNA-binding FadR family transcriptional regulator|nr:FadR family transcriptional regulator [Betaproteobacteria bacterium]NBP45028.1 FadR family transcriptional regulator [Betaproteobacteria bacterium]